MKIILEESDLKRIDKINTAKRENPDEMCGWVQDTDRTYDLTITVNDIGKANNFLWYFMTRQESERKLIEEQIGFSLKSINFITKEEVIRRLKSQIDDYFNNLL